MRILIIDPVGGISGDMLLGSLIHLGCPVDYVKGILDMLPIEAFTMGTSFRSVGGINALDLKFSCHECHTSRTYTSIRDEILAPLPGTVRRRAGAIFLALAEAEAAVHGVGIDEVHFHEVGALDSILDITGIAAAIEYFAVDSIYSRSVPLGTGKTKSGHGTIPLPAPATVKLLEGRKVILTEIPCELSTPTGAAAVSALALKGEPPSDLVIRATGYGCGDRQIPGWPNLCRTILCELRPDGSKDRMYIVEADIDDMNPEETEAALARIVDAGAKDAGLTPKIMKRGRPGFCIQAVCPSDRLEIVVGALLTHTTSIGARYYPIERRVLDRTCYSISTRFGKVMIKESVLPDGSKRFKPEYRDIAAIAEERGLSVAAVRSEVERAMKEEAGLNSPDDE